jgi:hypothetical protein
MGKPQKADIGNIFVSEPTAQPSQKANPRDGKKQTVFNMPETAKKQFDHLGIELGKTKQALMAEAVNLLFQKYGKSPIA